MDEVDENLLHKNSKNLAIEIITSERGVPSASLGGKELPLLQQDGVKSEKLSESYRIPPSRLWVEVTVALSLSLAVVTTGCTYGFTGIALPAMMNSTTSDIILSKDQAALFSSSIIIGSMVGSLFIGPILVHIGQKRILLSSSIMGIIGVIVGNCSHHFWLLIASRIMLGVHAVAIGSSLGSYLAEIADPVHRGRLLAMLELARQIGFLYVFIVGSTDLSWRHTGLLCGLSSATIPLLIMPFLPNSPRWLVLRGRYEEAKSAIAFFRGLHHDNEPILRKIIEDVSKHSKKDSFVTQFKLLGKRSILKRFLIMCYIHFSMHFTGNFIMVIYAVNVFKSTGSNFSEYMSTILVGLIRVIGGFIYIIIADKIRRRFLLLPSLSIVCLCTLLLGGYYRLEDEGFDLLSVEWLPIVAALLFNLALNFSFPIIMVSKTEILPNSVRALAISLLYLPLFSGAFIVTLTYPYMVDYIGSDWTFWLYSINSFILTIVCYFTIPETKGKTLEEINQRYHKVKKVDFSN